MRLTLPLGTFAFFALTLAACSTVPGKSAMSPKAQRGKTFAQAHCAACHGIGVNEPSPNPESPTFEAVANMPGLTEQSLREFLRDSHNFPAAMNFEVGPRQVDELAAYAVTLRRADYKPEI